MVIDFDYTLMNEHLWAKHRNAHIDTIKIGPDNFVDIEGFRQMHRVLVASGTQFAVATFGRREVVQKALRVALGPAAEKIVVTTPIDFGVPEGSGDLGDKNTQLQGLCDRWDISLDAMVFCDDDPQNVEMAKQAGVQAIHCPTGLTFGVLQEAADALGLHFK